MHSKAAVVHSIGRSTSAGKVDRLKLWARAS